MSRRNSILIVDDDEVARNLLKEILLKEGCDVTLASSGEEAIEKSKNHFYSIVCSDIRMLELDGLDVLKHFQNVSPRTVVILMTAFGSMETAVQAIKEGAFDYISKPFKLDEFKNIFKKALKQAEALQTPEANSPKSNKEIGDVKAMIGSSPKMLEIFKTLARAAMTHASVLIIGESGTGKELIARAIFENSSRRNKKFIAVNCGAFSETLLESELFGHMKGAFTGANETRRGIFEEADNGTLFLDEIGDISPQMQVKILRAIQEGEIRPVGSTDTKKVDVRIIAATHRNLHSLVKEGKFREDLYYRLKVVLLEIPPLRDRIEDIPELSSYFLNKYVQKNNKRISKLTDQALDAFKKYSWPGNVRELENTIERIVALSNSSQIDIEDLPSEIKTSNNNPNSRTESVNQNSLEDLEKKHILQTLQETNYNKSKAAEKLGIDRTTLYRKAQKYGIDLKEK